MTSTAPSTALRTSVRLALAGLFLVLVGSGAAGFADTPAGWEDSPNVSGFEWLLVLFLIPLGLFLLITTLTLLPSLVRRSSGTAIEPRSRE